MWRRLKTVFVPRELKLSGDDEEHLKFDPFQVFEVAPEPCRVLRVTVISGRNITKGWTGDLLDTPDPYVVLKVRSTPNSSKRTRCIDNDPNPRWNETFEFYLDRRNDDVNILDVTVRDANYTIDETLASLRYDLSRLELDEDVDEELRFGTKSSIFLRFNLTKDTKPDLRYSLSLCDDEKKFLARRKKRVLDAMRQLLGTERGPKNLQEVPVVGLLGSGGGFRAMVCLSGVVKALWQEGIIDCTTFMAGLSGSAWYLSTLYSHGHFPDSSPGELQDELKRSIEQSPFWLLGPTGVYRYISSIFQKKRAGQPVSFTDFFGHMLGDTLLVQRYESRLTDQREKLVDGRVPLPLYTCLHVKRNVMARVFQEWIEFSPYEVGIAKYGTFMKSEHFGSKFYMGRLVKPFQEYPLHYLQGVWGSAFCILFRQLTRDKGQKDLMQVLQQDLVNMHEEHRLQEHLENFTVDDLDHDSEPSDTEDEGGVDADKESHRRPSKDVPQFAQNIHQAARSASIWSTMTTALMNSRYFNTLSGRAASIFNPLRGLSLHNIYPLSPFSPTTPGDEMEFKGQHEPLSTANKTLYLVDSGLTFNSPYPLLLRPQRGVDLLLSFDFSARPTDKTPPFKEILMAELWASKNGIPFPPIAEIVREKYAKEPIRESYVFHHPTDPCCPVILHFAIVNEQFRKFKSPGVLRTTEAELSQANFTIFDDPKQPYSLYNFSFSHDQFERLAGLMEFNTLISVDIIRDAMAEIVARKRQTQPRPPFTLADVARLKLRLRHKDAIRQLKNYVRSFSKVDDVPDDNGHDSLLDNGHNAK